MECEHVCNWYPKEEVVRRSSFWSWTREVFIKLHWYCDKCGVELQPVFREKVGE
jgi:hypothetical protein